MLRPLPIHIVDVDKEEKKKLIAGVKWALERLQSTGHFDKDIVYSDILASPKILDYFFNQFVEYRSDCAEILVDDKGVEVRGDDQPLSCGFTINQIAYLLIQTCTKRLFGIDQINALSDQVAAKPKTVDKSSALALFAKGEKTAVCSEMEQLDLNVMRKFRLLHHHIRSPWQVKLLPHLRDLSLPHVAFLKDHIVDLTTPESIDKIGAINVPVLQVAKKILGKDFGMVLSVYPDSIKGMVVWPPEMVAYFRELLGDSVWRFFTRDNMFFNAAISLHPSIVLRLGVVLSYIHLNNLEEIMRLNADKLEILIEAFRTGFGEELMRQAFESPDFVTYNLRKTIDNILHSNKGSTELLTSIAITCQSNVSDTKEWLEKKANCVESKDKKIK